MDRVFYMVTSENFDAIVVDNPSELIGLYESYSQQYGIELTDANVTRVRIEVLED